MISSSDQLLLLKAENFREFLELALNFQYNKKVNLADFSRRCQIKSRCFIREVIYEKKGLSVQTLNGIAAQLKIPKLLADYFKYLVYQELPALIPPVLTVEKVLHLKNEIKITYPKIFKNSQIEELFVDPWCHRIFCSIPHSGITLQQLKSVSTIGTEKLSDRVSALIQVGLVKQRDDVLFLSLKHFENLNQSDVKILRELIINVAQDILEQEKKGFEGYRFSTQFRVFTIDPSRKLEFTKKLNCAINQLFDEYCDDDQIAQCEVFNFTKY